MYVDFKQFGLTVGLIALVIIISKRFGRVDPAESVSIEYGLTRDGWAAFMRQYDSVTRPERGSLHMSTEADQFKKKNPQYVRKSVA